MIKHLCVGNRIPSISETTTYKPLSYEQTSSDTTNEIDTQNNDTKHLFVTCVTFIQQWYV